MTALRSVDAAEDTREFERVCRADEVAHLMLRAAVLQDGTRVCVGNRDGAFFAMIDRCPHQQFPLSDGELLADGSVVCARHGAAYCSSTGLSVRGPKGEAPCGRMTLCQVRVTDGDVFVRAPLPRF
ncbi:MAG TPA: Rieske 2Fe-2S domain-containing protein [Gemmatimonadaceae bacterium]|nr:Rieske 2Fe-2S domain-containing protein [Gemmatimonadaceae bacterium]